MAAVRRIAIAKRGVTPKLTRARYLAAVETGAAAEGRFAATGSGARWRGSSSRRSTSSHSSRTGDELVPTQLAAFRKAFAGVNLSYARSKNLTPYDVLKIASMIEKETVAPRERKLVAAVIYNRLHNRMPLGIDATIRYGLNIPGTQSLTKAALASRLARTTAVASRDCRRRRSRILASPRSGRPLIRRRSTISTTSASPGRERHFFTASESEFLRKVCEFGYACN